jgi:hypothetical protein
MSISYNCLMFVCFYPYLFVVQLLASYCERSLLRVPENVLKATRFGGHLSRSHGLKTNAASQSRTLQFGLSSP